MFELSRFSNCVLLHVVLVSLPVLLVPIKLLLFLIRIVFWARLVAETVASFEEVRGERLEGNRNIGQVLQDDAYHLLSPGSVELVESITDRNAEALLGLE